MPSNLPVRFDQFNGSVNHELVNISINIGFEYPTYFNNFFKRLTGTNPKTLRVQEV
jgi:AraC family transcriptional activator of pobA